MTFASEICGMGSYLPARKVTNEELAPLLGVTPDWIEVRSGIRSRYWGEPAQATSDLGLEAAKRALDDAKLTAKDLDLIVFATLSPDHEFPGSGFFLQSKLKTRTIPVFDLRAQCSGFVYGLSIADKFVSSGEYGNVLVVGAEMHSKGLELTPEGKQVAMLFGDGAGAFVLRQVEAGPRKNIQAMELHADGKFARALWIEGPGTGLGLPSRLDASVLAKNQHHPQMDGPTVFMAAITRMTEVILSVLARESLTPADVGLFVLHQANLRIVERVAQNLGVPMERFHNTIQETANTTAASIPIGLLDARLAGKLAPGTRVVSATFGAGFSWSAVIFNF
ncbi:MAG: ketoacyl-ACP synthase III [Archangium sp.]|nr:ketoacyl-ACP synthase III [Archangium sp.]